MVRGIPPSWVRTEVRGKGGPMLEFLWPSGSKSERVDREPKEVTAAGTAGLVPDLPGLAGGTEAAGAEERRSRDEAEAGKKRERIGREREQTAGPIGS